MDTITGGGTGGLDSVNVATMLATLTGLLMCAACHRCFDTVSGLGRHHQASDHVPEYAPLPARKGRRHHYSFRRKRDIILDVLGLTAELGGPTNAKRARDTIYRRTGISTSNLDKWVRNREHIFACARTRRLGGKSRFREAVARWPLAEYHLYMRFIYRRRFQALRVTRNWLRTNFKDVRSSLGHNVDGYYPSQGWCSRFCKRWEITSQCRTNKKKFSIAERMPKIQAFHQYWILGVQNTGEPRCPKYGRFPASHIYAMDQVPMPFSSPSKRSLNEKGSRRGNRFTAASEDDKRFCTLQVTVCAQADDQDVCIELIFRNGTGGEGISAEEKALYEREYPGVRIRWQHKAWADEEICMDYVLDFRRQTMAKGDVALILDNLGSQSTPGVRSFMHFLDITNIFLPANCTDCISPVDRNIGQWLKSKVYQMQEAELDLDENRNWPLPVAQGGLGVAQKRMHIVRWVDAAWKEMKRERKHCINSAFVDSGILIAKNRTEDHLVRLRPGDECGLYTY